MSTIIRRHPDNLFDARKTKTPTDMQDMNMTRELWVI
jgi:hypothetical protein